MKNDYTEEQIAAIGNHWVHPGNGEVRYYLEADKLIGLEISHYKTGNISGAWIGGERISNTAGRRFNGCKVYWTAETGVTFGYREGGNEYVAYSEEIFAGIDKLLGIDRSSPKAEEATDQASAPTEDSDIVETSAGIDTVEDVPEGSIAVRLPHDGGRYIVHLGALSAPAAALAEALADGIHRWHRYIPTVYRTTNGQQLSAEHITMFGLDPAGHPAGSWRGWTAKQDLPKRADGTIDVELLLEIDARRMGDMVAAGPAGAFLPHTQEAIDDDLVDAVGALNIITRKGVRVGRNGMNIWYDNALNGNGAFPTPVTNRPWVLWSAPSVRAFADLVMQGERILLAPVGDSK